MNAEQLLKLANYVKGVTDEHFESIAIVGVVAGSEDIVVYHTPVMTPKTKLCLSNLLAGAVASVQAAPEP